MASVSIVRRMIAWFPFGLLFVVFAGIFLFPHCNSKPRVRQNNDGPRSAVIDSSEAIEADLRDFVTKLSVRIGERHAGKPDSLDACVSYLKGTLGISNFRYQVMEQRFAVDGIDCSNIEVEVPGTSRADEIVVVGAHYDSAVGSPGANDNASGVAALLWLAEKFRFSNNQRTLRFVAFVNEEPPYFQTPNMGSFVYAKRCQERGEKIVGMVSLETIGYYSDEPGSQKRPPGLQWKYPDTANFIGVVTRVRDGEFARKFAADFATANDFPIEVAALPQVISGVGFSDHWSFWQHGYPALMVTDTAFYRYPDYHLPSDTMDKLDFPRMVQVTKGLEAAIKALLNPR